MTHSLNSLSSNAVRVAESSFFAFVAAHPHFRFRSRLRSGNSLSARPKQTTEREASDGSNVTIDECLFATLRSKSIEACKQTPARLKFGFF